MSEFCRCANYLYIAKNNEVIKVYSRYYAQPDAKVGCLVYDIENLKEGFTGKIIYE